MDIIFKFLVRALLVVVGLVFAASLIIVMLVLLVLWSLRAVWCKLTGQPINPFVMRMNPRAGFDRVFKQTERSATTLRKPLSSRMDDVTDVEPRG
jgi:flagellar biosynthesis protein FlhB